MFIDLIQDPYGNHPEDFFLRLIPENIQTTKLFRNQLIQLNNGQYHKIELVGEAKLTNETNQLEIIIGNDNLGVFEKDRNRFLWTVSMEQFPNIIEKLGYFLEDTRGYNWLTDDLNAIELLYSPTGGW